MEVESFIPLPKPYVTLYGAATNAAGRPLAKLVELTGSRYRYTAVVEVPQIQFCENEIQWTVNHDGEVAIEGQISPAAIFADKPIVSNKRNRVKLCPTEPWAISFYFPGPVDVWTTLVYYTPDNLLEITVLKTVTEASASDSTVVVTVVDSSAASLITSMQMDDIPAGLPFTQVADTSASGSTDFVPVADPAPDPEDEISLTPSEIMHMVEGWLV